jgi:hypothetical protein
VKTAKCKKKTRCKDTTRPRKLPLPSRFFSYVSRLTLLSVILHFIVTLVHPLVVNRLHPDRVGVPWTSVETRLLRRRSTRWAEGSRDIVEASAPRYELWLDGWLRRSLGHGTQVASRCVEVSRANSVLVLNTRSVGMRVAARRSGASIQLLGR